MCDRRGSLLYKLFCNMLVLCHLRASLFYVLLHGYIKSISSDSKLTVSKLSTDLTVV